MNVKVVKQVAIDLAVISVACFAFIYAREMLFFGVDQRYSFGFFLRGIFEQSVVSIMVCGLVFECAYRFNGTLTKLFKASLIASIWFLVLSYFLWITVFYNSGYYKILADAQLNSISEYLYFFMTPITLLTVSAYLMGKVNQEPEEDIQPKKEDQSSQENLSFVLEFFLFVGACIAFVYIKECLWNGVPDRLGIGLYFGIGSAIVAYPPIFLGLRILKSVKAFFVLSWLGVILVHLLFLEASDDLERFLYMLISPKLFVAIWASILFYQNRNE